MGSIKQKEKAVAGAVCRAAKKVCRPAVLYDVLGTLCTALLLVSLLFTFVFRQVTVEEGAQVQDCVIMNDCVIGAGAEVRCAILDKNVVVRPGSRLIGTPDNPVIVKRGDIV